MTKDEALKVAIEYFEHNIPRAKLQGTNYEKVFVACKDALEQPEKEPVAWMDGLGYVMSKQRKIETQGGVGDAYTIPLYTRPAPSWQGLSDDEIFNCEADAFLKMSHDTWELDFYGYARAIEQALKEKNNAV
jgi:hypothetical protein